MLAHKSVLLHDLNNLHKSLSYCNTIWVLGKCFTKNYVSFEKLLLNYFWKRNKVAGFWNWKGGIFVRRSSSFAGYGDQQFFSSWPYKNLLQPFTENICEFFLGCYFLEHILYVAVLKSLEDSEWTFLAFLSKVTGFQWTSLAFFK